METRGNCRVWFWVALVAALSTCCVACGDPLAPVVEVTDPGGEIGQLTKHRADALSKRHQASLWIRVVKDCPPSGRVAPWLDSLIEDDNPDGCRSSATTNQA